jgi:hypothetical protein
VTNSGLRTGPRDFLLVASLAAGLVAGGDAQKPDERFLPRSYDGPSGGTLPYRLMVEALRSVGADIEYTEYRFSGHAILERAYSEDGLRDWKFAQRKRR